MKMGGYIYTNIMTVTAIRWRQCGNHDNGCPETSDHESWYVM